MLREFSRPDAPATSFRAAIFILLAVIGVEIAAILTLNAGHFMFTLDDPYIHLALAENILRGHYGVNVEEFSSPSSSILWPFLIAPFSMLRGGVYVVLLLNVALSVGIVRLFWKISAPPSPPDVDKRSEVYALQFVALVAMMSATNMVGLIFTGMEHCAQLLCSLLIIHGRVNEVNHRSGPWWFPAVIIVAPLVRYECLALSLPAAVFLLFRGHRIQAGVAATSLLLLPGAFSLFLVTLGLPPFPGSVMAKTGILSGGGALGTLILNFKKN